MTDFNELFKGADFKAVLNEINTLGWNSGLKDLKCIELVQLMKKIVPLYKDGFEENSFIQIILGFSKD